MLLSDVSIKRPVFATVVSLLLIILGVASLLRLSVREYPDIDPPVVSVRTVYIGASAEVIDREVTQALESRISGIEGIKRITSTSRDQVSSISIEFDLNRDIDAAANDIRDKVSRGLGALPDEVEPPVIAKTEADSRPMMWIGLSGENYDGLELTDYIERNLKDRISVIPGVANIIIGGERRYAMRIWLNRESLAARKLTVDDVINAIRRENVELPAGRLESLQREFTVRLNSRLSSADEFKNIVIRQVNGVSVRLGEVARVELGAEDERGILRLNGVPTVGIGVVRQSKANTIKVADSVRAELDLVEKGLPQGMSLTIGYDQALFIKASIREVMIALLISMLLVVTVIYLFLRSARATLIPAVAIPVSIIASFMVMAIMGYSINVLTLLALVLAIGLVVDDAIVVLENIHRRMEEGETPLVASYKGARQIAFAVIATTLVLISVFVPLSFMQGSTGRLFTEFGIAMAAAVLFSSFVALTLTPMMCSKLLTSQSMRSADHVSWFDKINNAYKKILLKTQSRLGLVLLAGLMVSLLAVVVYANLKQELAPTEDRSGFMVAITAPEGSSLEYTQEQVFQVEEILQQYVDSGEINNIFSIIAPGFSGPGQVNSAFMFVKMVGWDERSRSQQDIVRNVFPKLLALPGAQAFAINPAGLGQRGFGADVQLVVGASDHESARIWSQQLLQAAREEQRLLNANINFKETKPELRLNMNRDKAADLGISMQTIGRTLQVLLGSSAISNYIDRNEAYDVILQLEDWQRRGPQDLAFINVRQENKGTEGELIPLSNLVELQEAAGPKDLRRVDRLPAVTLSASLAKNYFQGDALRDLEAMAAATLPPEAKISYAGMSREFLESSNSLKLTFAFAILIVFLVLAAQFESWVHPLTIMLTVPIAITGGLATILIVGSTLNIYSQIGLLLLVGLVAKNGILVVEFANQLRNEGQAIKDAVINAAATRFRPILMTSIATMFGAVPLIISSGAGAESRQALAMVIIGGMIFATALTLFVIPALYKILAPYSRASNAVALELEKTELTTRQN